VGCGLGLFRSELGCVVDITVRLRGSQNAGNYLLVGQILIIFSSDFSGLIELCKHSGPPSNKTQCTEKYCGISVQKKVWEFGGLLS
jgi:hypothetical protein